MATNMVKELNATHDTVSRINHTICDLHPSTTYSGSIEMMPIVGGYWSDESQPVPEIDKNGEMIFYNVTLWPKGKAKIMNVDAIERPHFMVESVSNNSSESGTNTVDVVILGDSVEQMTKSRAHYMICWCEKDRGSCKRMSVLQCVPSQMKTTSLQLADPENKMYAVAMVTKAAPTVSPNSVKASPGSEDNTINVIWDKLTCQSWQPFIAFYVVQYCTVVKEGINSCKGTVDSVEVPEKDYSYMLTDLKEDEVYRIVVRGMTRDGKSTPDSEPAFAQAINKTLKPSDKGLDNNGYLVPSDRNIPINEELHNDKKRIERQGSKDSGYPMSPTNSPPPDDYSWVRENESGSSTSDDANNEKKDGVVDRMPHKDSTDPLMPGVVNSDYVLNVGDTSVKQLNESGDGADKTCNARDDGETLQKEVDNGNVDSTKDSGFTEKSFLRTKSNQHISICSDNSLDDYRKATISEEGSQCSRRSLQSKNTGNVRLSDQKSLNTDNVQYTENPELSQTEQDSLPSSRHISLQSISSDASVQMIEQIHAKNLLLENKLHITNIPVPTLFNKDF
ncbi:hypothetical protein MAR_037296 [Mya arenaria]|uniref:Fibronectin type-III domain-containing protein n=1 Tax=Mya arenaria TaxID=6604 RepID=A0ABY7FPS7_MYAAR|nr:hypothetical protein MAR_037296 [Mya arenaria]